MSVSVVSPVPVGKCYKFCLFPSMLFYPSVSSSLHITLDDLGTRWQNFRKQTSSQDRIIYCRYVRSHAQGHKLFQQEADTVQDRSVLQFLVRVFRCVRKNFEKQLLASSCVSVRPYTSRFIRDGFPCNLIFENFSKICRENSSVIEMWQV
jgi:hypothetical protein